MYTNKDITVYSIGEGEFTRTEIRNVFWNESVERITTDKGIEHHKSVTVYIPLSSVPDNFSLNVGDVVIKGITKYIPLSSDEKGFSEWHRYIKKHYSTCTVTAISMHDYGSSDMQHIKAVMT